MAITRTNLKIQDTAYSSLSPEEVSPETEGKLREMFHEIEKQPGAYSIDKTLNEFRKKKAAGKECPNAPVWVAEKYLRSSFMDCSGENRELSVCCMTPAVFALLTDPDGLIPWMLKTIRNKSAETFAAPDFYCVWEDYGTDPLDDIFEGKENAAYKNNPPELELYFAKENCSADSCSVILGACFADQKKENALWYSVLKAYGKDRPKGWLSILPVVKKFRFVTEIFRSFPALSVTADADRLVDLLLYIKKRDSSMYAEMMSKYVYLTLLVCSLDNLGNRNVSIEKMKKLYLEEFGDEDMFWDILLKKRTGKAEDMFMCNPFGFPDWDSLHTVVWKKITGRPLLLNADELDLSVLYTDPEEPFGSIPPFGGANNGFVNDVGMLTGGLLMELIRNSDMAVYGKHSRKAVFDMEYILKEGTEELVLMALRKDFIRKEDLDVCFSYIKENKKYGIAPALVLKQNGEWPAYGEGCKEEKTVKGRRRCHG